MTALEFLRALWPDEGFYCLAFPFKHGFYHKVFDTIEDAAEHALEVRRTQDIFFCMNTLAERRVWYPEEIDPRTGRAGKWCERKHANMAWVKCFFADLDVGDSTTAKKFPTKGAAIRALQNFLAETGLPCPTVNSSGRGVHIFWPLDEKMPTTDWKPYATKLKRLMRHHSLWADPTRVDDESSVLRVAGTFHLKDPASPRLVQTEYRAVPVCRAEFLAQLDEAYIRSGLEAPVSTDNGVVSAVPARQYRRNNIADSVDSVKNSVPVTIDAVGKACAQVRWLVRNAADLNNDQWYQGVVQTFRHVEDGRSVIDAVSALHGDRLARVDTKLRQLESGDIGPTTCAKMAEMCGEDLCHSCALFGKVKAPLVAARRTVISLPPPVGEAEIVGQTDEETAAQPSTLPDAPVPWSRGSAGISRTVKTETGDSLPQMIYDHDLYPLRVISNDSTQIMQSEWRAHLPKDRAPVDFLVDTTALYDPRGMIQTIMNTGIVVKPENLNDVRDYMIDYLKELQRYVDDSKQFSHLGWKDNYRAFILADKILSKDTLRKANLSSSARSVAEHVGSRGTLERQIEVVQFYNRPEWIGHQFFILCSLASPLFYATGQDGVIVNASGESGASKSTALYTGASFWGEPKKYTLNGNNKTMTAIFRNQRMMTLANLPFCVDEITKMSNEDVQDMVMNATQPDPGRKGCQTNLSERKSVTSDRSSIMMCSANSSLHDKLSVRNQAGTAGSMRVFEMSFTEVSRMFKPAADSFLRDLRQNYGHIGEAFIKVYLANQEEYEARIIAKLEEIDDVENMATAERFWSAVMAAALVAGEIAVEAGLLPYDTQAIRTWLHTYQIPKMRGIITHSYSRPVDVLADYIDKITPDILVVNRNAGNIYAPKGVRGALLARFETHSGLLWLHKQTFKEHCQKVGATMSQVVEALVSSGVITNDRMQRTLGAGTEYAHGQTWCMQINLGHPDMKEAAEKVETPQLSHKVVPLR